MVKGTNDGENHQIKPNKAVCWLFGGKRSRPAVASAVGRR
jgi:hypothetical protein